MASPNKEKCQKLLLKAENSINITSRQLGNEETAALLSNKCYNDFVDLLLLIHDLIDAHKVFDAMNRLVSYNITDVITATGASGAELIIGDIKSANNVTFYQNLGLDFTQLDYDCDKGSVTFITTVTEYRSIFARDLNTLKSLKEVGLKFNCLNLLGKYSISNIVDYHFSYFLKDNLSNLNSNLINYNHIQVLNFFKNEMGGMDSELLRKIEIENFPATNTRCMLGASNYAPSYDLVNNHQADAPCHIPIKYLTEELQTLVHKGIDFLEARISDKANWLESLAFDYKNAGSDFLY